MVLKYSGWFEFSNLLTEQLKYTQP